MIIFKKFKLNPDIGAPYLYGLRLINNHAI